MKAMDTYHDPQIYNGHLENGSPGLEGQEDIHPRTTRNWMQILRKPYTILFTP